MALNGSNECVFLPSLRRGTRRNEVTLGDPVEAGPSFWSRSTHLVAGNSCHVEPRLGIHCGHEGIQLCPPLPLPRNAQSPPRNAEIRAYAKGGIHIARYASGLLTSGDDGKFLVSGQVDDDIFRTGPIRIRRIVSWKFPRFRGRKLRKREG